MDRPNYRPMQRRWLDTLFFATHRQTSFGTRCRVLVGYAHAHTLFSGVKVDTSDLVQKAALDDPTNLGLRMGLGFTYLFSNRVDEAISVFQETISLNPNTAGANFRLGQALIIVGDYDAAIEAMENEIRDGFQVAGRALVYQALGNSERAQDELDRLIALGNVWTYEIAMVYAYRGEIDEAFAWLERAYDRRDQGLNLIVSDPFMANLYGDPRFDLMIERLGRTAHWELRKSEL